MLALAVDRYSRLPILRWLVEVDTGNARSIVAMNLLILEVLLMRHDPQVIDAVVKGIAVDVINILGRPLTIVI